MMQNLQGIFWYFYNFSLSGTNFKFTPVGATHYAQINPFPRRNLPQIMKYLCKLNEKAIFFMIFFRLIIFGIPYFHDGFSQSQRKNSYNYDYDRRYHTYAECGFSPGRYFLRIIPGSR
jgi:hypothetical protein